MLHTIEIPKRDLTDIDENHHEISSYCRQCLEEFKGGKMVVKQSIGEDGIPYFDTLDFSELVEYDGSPWTRKSTIGFAHWDKEVENLDDDYSDEAMCFNMSSRLKWKDVELVHGHYGGIYSAPSIERLKEVLSHVYICAWCPLDI